MPKYRTEADSYVYDNLIYRIDLNHRRSIALLRALLLYISFADSLSINNNDNGNKSIRLQRFMGEHKLSSFCCGRVKIPKIDNNFGCPITMDQLVLR